MRLLNRHNTSTNFYIELFDYQILVYNTTNCLFEETLDIFRLLMHSYLHIIPLLFGQTYKILSFTLELVYLQICTLFAMKYIILSLHYC